MNEQMKSIQKELGTVDDENEIEDLQNSINKAKMPKEAKKKAQGELNKLQRMSSQSSDASIIRTYIENLCLYIDKIDLISRKTSVRSLRSEMTSVARSTIWMDRSNRCRASTSQF